MYLSYFGLDSLPFSIVPDHRALYMSHSHREAVAHLLYALNESGGFVQLTGEVGTGKTTVSRYILANLPEDVDVALLLNPRITEKEMLEIICDELGLKYRKSISQKDLVSKLNNYLIDAHAKGRKTVLIIDEAQNLSTEVLEQVRLLTNLETSSAKLLQIILIGQPELAQTLKRHDLRQLSQRIVGRFSLKPLSRQETREYIEHRLKINGAQRTIFSNAAIALVHRLSAGIPRVINVLCDRALLGAYSQSKSRVTRKIVQQSGHEVLTESPRGFSWRVLGWLKYASIALLPLLAYLVWQSYQANHHQAVWQDSDDAQQATQVVDQEAKLSAANTIDDLSTEHKPESQETPSVQLESLAKPSADQSTKAIQAVQASTAQHETMQQSVQEPDTIAPNVKQFGNQVSNAQGQDLQLLSMGSEESLLSDPASANESSATMDDLNGSDDSSVDPEPAEPSDEGYDLTFRLGVPLEKKGE